MKQPRKPADEQEPQAEPPDLLAQRWPADAVERRPVGSLVAYGRNARIHTDQQVDQIAASMKEFGFAIPLLADEAGVLIAGHGRLEAAKRLGWETVPVMVARGWSERQVKAYRIADNKLALNAAWDVNLLSAELGELQGLEELIGFSTEELVDLFKQDEPPDEFPESDENIDVEHTCPRCGFRWSGQSTTAPADEQQEQPPDGAQQQPDGQVD